MALVAQVDFAEGWEGAWARIAAFLPKFVAFLAILIIGWFVAKGIEKILDRVLERVGFDRVVERGGLRRALEGTRYDASSILAKIAFYAAFLFVLQLAFGLFGPNPVSDLVEGLIAFLPRIFVAILIVVITAFVATGLRDIVQASLGGLDYGRILATAAMALVWVVGLAAALNQIEVAPEVVNGLLYAMLALVVGVGIVAIGGGGIQPMRDRWERVLGRIEREAPRVRREAQGATERIDLTEEEIRPETAGGTPRRGGSSATSRGGRRRTTRRTESGS
ncbi:MAG: mechanosensitive ion channel family protein [Actinomycetota bacterium]